MDLHVYRNSQDRWYDLKSAARERGAVLAVNTVTLDELVQRLTPDIRTATPNLFHDVRHRRKRRLPILDLDHGMNFFRKISIM